MPHVDQNGKQAHQGGGPGVEAGPLILASASPRRRELLGTLGLPFEVAVADVDERPHAAEPALALARRLAVAKATAIAATHAGALVLGADTVVTQDGQVYGKPTDRAEAADTLRRLRDAPHQVTTAVCVVGRGGVPLVDAALTTVWMRPYTDAEIAAYVASGEPFDKAGGYGIQDPQFRPAARIVGCYTNVVGLPLCTTRDLLRRVGLMPHTVPTCHHAGD
jgi:MAF protein